jgi:hypothetical protein
MTGSDSEVYAPGDLVLVSDQYQPLNPIPAVVEEYAPETGRVRVQYRQDGYVAWIDAGRIVGRDTRAQGGPAR